MATRTEVREEEVKEVRVWSERWEMGAKYWGSCSIGEWISDRVGEEYRKNGGEKKGDKLLVSWRRC